MTYKTILAVAEYTEAPPANLAAVVDLARQLDAHLTVLLVGAVPPLPFYGYGGAGYAKIWLEEEKERAARLIGSAEMFRQMLNREDISYDVRPHQAIMVREDNLVARHAIYADIAVILRSGPGPLSLFEHQAIDGTVFDSGRPALLLPVGGDVSLRGRHVLVAWNSRPEAAEALADALPFLKAAELVTILIVDPVSGPDDHGEDPGADIALVLARHGVAAEVRRADAGAHTVSEVIRREAVAVGADMIVMGAYGHSRMKQYVLGGTTRDMFETTALPLLVAH